MGKRLLGLVVVLALLFTASAVVRTVFFGDDFPAAHVRAGTVAKPISASVAKKYALDVPAGTHAFVVANGEIDGRKWFAAAYQSPDGEACIAIRGYTRVDECRRLERDRPTVERLGAEGLRGVFVNYGLTKVAVRKVVFLTDSGRHWATEAVRPGGADFRVFAVRAPQLRSGAVELAWVANRGIERSPEVVPPGTVVCTAAEPPRHGIPDGLPHAGSTTMARVYDVRAKAYDELRQKYGATEVIEEARNGAVWRKSRGGTEVVEAADFLLRLYLPSASGCPEEPQSYDGVPLSFVIGAAPAPVTAFGKSATTPTTRG